MRKVGLVYKKSGEAAVRKACEVIHWLRDRGVEPLMDSDPGDDIHCSPEAGVVDGEVLGNCTEFVISLGGDGTLLYVAGLLNRSDVPILGVHMAFASNRLARIDDQQLIYKLPDGDVWGRDHIKLSPMELLDRLAALIPPPRRRRHTYAGVFAPNSRWRPLVAATAGPDPGPGPHPGHLSPPRRQRDGAERTARCGNKRV